MIHEPSHMAGLYRKLERTKQLEERDRRALSDGAANNFHQLLSAIITMVGLVNKEVSKNALTIHSDPSKDTQFSIERAVDRAILDIKHNLSEHSVSFVCESAKINKIFHYKLLEGKSFSSGINVSSSTCLNPQESIRTTSHLRC